MLDDCAAMKTLPAILMYIILATPGWSQKPMSYPIRHIKELNKTLGDTVRVKAYIVDTYVCPPCPEGAQCKPCMEDHITVTEKKNTKKISAEEKLRILTVKAGFFTRGDKYLFIIAMGKNKENKEDAFLVSFKRL